jgi:hypothetical protein
MQTSTTVDRSEGYERAVESYRQALRYALKPEDAKDAIEAFEELLSVAKMVGAEEAQGTGPMSP